MPQRQRQTVCGFVLTIDLKLSLNRLWLNSINIVNNGFLFPRRVTKKKEVNRKTARREVFSGQIRCLTVNRVQKKVFFFCVKRDVKKHTREKISLGFVIEFSKGARGIIITTTI